MYNVHIKNGKSTSNYHRHSAYLGIYRNGYSPKCSLLLTFNNSLYPFGRILKNKVEYIYQLWTGTASMSASCHKKRGFVAWSTRYLSILCYFLLIYHSIIMLQRVLQTSRVTSIFNEQWQYQCQYEGRYTMGKTPVNDVSWVLGHWQMVINMNPKERDRSLWNIGLTNFFTYYIHEKEYVDRKWW